MDKNKQEQKKQINHVSGLLERMKGQLNAALPKHMSADRMVRVVLTEIRKNPKLLECEQTSLFGAIVTASQLGLEPGLNGQCYLIPFENRRAGTTECQFVIGYKGYIDLARRTGDLVNIYAKPVHENDEFEFSFGVDGTLKHIPKMTDRGNIIGYYAFAQLKGGGFAYDFMTVSDVEKHRDKFSKAKKFGPWVDHFDAMAQKTVVRQMMKYMPMSVELQDKILLDERTIEMEDDNMMEILQDSTAGDSGRSEEITGDSKEDLSEADQFDFEQQMQKDTA